MHRRKPVLPAPRIKGMHSSRGKSRSHPARAQADPQGVSGRFRPSQPGLERIAGASPEAGAYNASRFRSDR
ncbi:hypothetical protein IPC1020_20590 [Pseudomonas aeruginosa]|nr:hypothetical protein IPC1280_16020 [Pseudomonas aeruginosa]RPS03230.1 hypothetical protein IPC1020_20590 [Pseudomonas aeruginosa]RUB02331.1 hypothetical protein IPC1439_13615 [Pseudomonas aeruginosa]